MNSDIGPSFGSSSAEAQLLVGRVLILVAQVASPQIASRVNIWGRVQASQLLRGDSRKGVVDPNPMLWNGRHPRAGERLSQG